VPSITAATFFRLAQFLYEMLSGERAFKGETAVDTISAILSKEPPEVTATNAAISPTLGNIVHRCLQKAPEHRFQSVSDVAFVIELVGGDSGVDSGARTRRADSDHARTGDPIRFDIHQPASARLETITTGTPQLALTPDGRTLAFTATCADGRDRVWLRPLERFDAEVIFGTDLRGARRTRRMLAIRDDRFCSEPAFGSAGR
jgi:serine/threonine protein kinase